MDGETVPDESGIKKRVSQLSNKDDLEMGDVKQNGTSNGHIIHEDIEYEPHGFLALSLAKLNESTESFMTKHRSRMSTLFKYALNGLVLGYLIWCLVYWFNYVSDPLALCSGVGSLIAFLTIIYFFVIYFVIVKRYLGSWLTKHVVRRFDSVWSTLWSFVIFRIAFSVSCLVALAAFFYIDTADNRERLISLIGLFVLLAVGFIFSKYPDRVNWKSVLMGLLLQFIFGLLFIRWSTGRVALQCFSDKVSTFLSYGVEGAAFVFGDFLVREQGVFAFSTLPVIFFFSMLVEVLFFWGALQWVVLKLGSVLQAATGTTVCEGIICVGNIFLGMTESVLIIKPYIALLTPSEIHVIMASGFATVSGTILASYIGFGADASHLVTASVMSAPAAICYAKLMWPETRRSLTTTENIKPFESEDQSALSAATRGATAGIALLLNIIANLVAFVAFIAFTNGVLGYCGGLLGFPTLNLEWIFGKVFIPLCWIMGVPWAECEMVGSLIGLKTVVNEFVAYQRMGELKAQGLLSGRAELIATYSLCGFTNPASAGIMIGSLSAMAPNQRETLSATAVRAFFTGCGICFMTACIAGLLMPEDSFGINTST